MRLAHSLAIALLSGCSALTVGMLAYPVEAQSSDDDDSEVGESDGDDDAEVPDPDDEVNDPGDDDFTDDPLDEDPGQDPGDDAPADEGSGDDGGFDDSGDLGAGDDDGAGSGDDDGAGSGDDDGPGSGDDDGPGSGDDDGPGSGDNDGAGSGDDDGPGSGDDDGTGSGDDDSSGSGDDDSSGSGDDDSSGSGNDGPGSGDDDSSGSGNDDFEFIGDEEITGGGAETEAERLARDEAEGIDTDRDGFRYRSQEFVALDLDPGDLAQLQADGFELLRSDQLDELGHSVHLLRGPAALSDADALTALEEVADPGSLSFNHLFDSSSARVRRTTAPAPPERTACGCTIGLIDSGVAANLSSFRHVSLEQRAFNGSQVSPRLHGTAVAHLFAGTRGREGQRTRILVADIFSGDRATSGSTYALVRALDWMAEQRVPVINVSLAGPRNNVVAQTVARLAGRGHLIVAAAGNDGPAAPPVFPGAYRNVVAVTAVDGRNRIYRYANRGTYVDFAARGVDVAAINTDGNTTVATGTSFAAPVVAARLASRLRTVDAQAARNAVDALMAEVTDLGEPGRDSTYGNGLVPEAR